MQNSSQSPEPVPLRVQCVLFDLDGTLIDSYGAIAECFNHARVRLGLPALSEGEVRGMVGHGLESLMEQAVGAARRDEGVRLFRERYDVICEDRTSALSGVAETVAELHRKGIKMGVATNKPARFAVRILRALSLMPPIEVVRGPGNGLPPKPDPALLHDALSALGASPAESLYVGDMGVDVESARRAGLRVWLVPTGSCSREELLRSGGDGLLERFDELAGLVRRA